MEPFTAQSEVQPTGDFPYFRRLWNTIVTALMAAAFIPLLLIGGGMYHYAASALEDLTLQSLRADVRHHQTAVDRFLAERVGDLCQIADTADLSALARPGAITAQLAALQRNGAYFTDLGIIDGQGRHLAYAGPYDLIRKNYRTADWFAAAMTRDVYISDVFSGFRKVPHFIIAVRRQAGDRTLILRATVDAVFFDRLVGKITAKEGGVSFLVNESGAFQTRPDAAMPWMGPSGVPIPERFDGIRVSEHNGQIRVMGWLKSVPWLSVVQLDKREIFKQLRQMRHVGIFVLVLGAILIGFTALLTTNHLVQRLERKRQNIHLMNHHLRCANRMTLSLQMFNGFFQEINETLSNIDSGVTWLQTQTNKPDHPETVDRAFDDHLTQLKDEILRSRETIHQLIAFSHPADPIVADVDINRILDDQIELFRREFYYNSIRVVRDYQQCLPSVRTDPSRLVLVFQNLMLNALSAADKDGEIVLKTVATDDRVRITVSDSGPGIARENMAKIFDPLFTTHPKRLGLGLAICRDIIEKMGGTITAESLPGQRTSFTVDLPIRFTVPKRA